MREVTVVGAGLAGCEAAWQLAQRGIPVLLREMKPEKRTPAHHYDGEYAELVCSNSFRGDRLENAVGLLKEELRRKGSLIMACADETRVEAGGALAVDRHAFAGLVTERIQSHPLIRIESGEVTEIPEKPVIIATGPLTSDALSQAIAAYFENADYLNFYDAAAPLVDAQSVDMELAWFASRYDRGSADYVNCAMDREEYLAFVQALATAEEAEVHGFEDAKVFEGCMPVEVMARRGVDTLRYGPLKPVGLRDPRTGREPMVAFAGQMTGVEGYVESTASGYVAAVCMAARLAGQEAPDFTRQTAHGALSHYIAEGSVGEFQPMNINFGILDPLDHRVKGKANKNLALANRALEKLKTIEDGGPYYEDHT